MRKIFFMVWQANYFLIQMHKRFFKDSLKYFQNCCKVLNNLMGFL